MAYFKGQFMLDPQDKNPDLLTDDEVEQLMVENNDDEYDELYLGDNNDERRIQ